MKGIIIKLSNNMDAIWNRIMAVLGAPWLVFIFMRYIEVTTGYNTSTVKIVVYFFLGVMIMAPTFLEAVISSFLSYLIFIIIRPWFIIGFFGFQWWNHQTACAAACAVGVANIIISLIVISRNGVE